MSFSVEGKLYKKFDTQNLTASFSKREFVLEIMDGQYPQHVLFQLLKERCNLIDSIEAGETIKAHFDLTGREYTSPKGEVRYFTNLNCWKIEKGGGTNTQSYSPPSAANLPAGDPFPSEKDAPPAVGAQDDMDDLPF